MLTAVFRPMMKPSESARIVFNRSVRALISDIDLRSYLLVSPEACITRRFGLAALEFGLAAGIAWVRPRSDQRIMVSNLLCRFGLGRHCVRDSCLTLELNVRGGVDDRDDRGYVSCIYD